MKLETAQQIAAKYAKTKSADYLKSLREEGVGTDEDDSKTGVQSAEDSSNETKTEKTHPQSKRLTQDAATEESLRESSAVQISSPEAEMAEKSGYVSFRTEDGFMTLGKPPPADGLAALDKAALEAAIETAAIKAENAGGEYVSFYPGDVKHVETEKRAESLPMYMRGFSDNSLAQYAELLHEMKLLVNEDAAALTSIILEEEHSFWVDLRDRITPETAAFLASAEVRGEAEARAALEILDGAKTASLIKELISLLDKPEKTQAVQTQARDDSYKPETVANAKNAAQTAAISDIFDILSGAEKSNHGGSENTIQANLPQDLSAKVGNNSFNNITTDNSENPQDSVTTRSNDNPKDVVSAHSNRNPQEAAAVHNNRNPQDVVTAHNNGNAPNVTTTRDVANPSIIPSPPDRAESSTPITPQFTATPADTAKMGAAEPAYHALANAIAKIPRLQPAHPKEILRFAETLTRVIETENTVVKTPVEQLEELFTNISKGKDNRDLGGQLARARQELFLRLTLIEEAISSMASPQRETALGQVQRLINHVRTLNGSDQYVYMQLPLKIDDRETTATLYIYKNKKKSGNRQIDPENVNILLSLELEHLGKWEGLINIKNKAVSIKMKVSGEEHVGFFRANTVMLHKLLHEVGFELKDTAIRYAREDTTPQTVMLSFDQLRVGSKKETGAMDYTV